MANPTNALGVTLYSDQDLLDQARAALFNVMLGKAVLINGRNLTREDAAQIRETITFLEQRIADDANAQSGAAGNTSVVTFNDPV